MRRIEEKAMEKKIGQDLLDALCAARMKAWAARDPEDAELDVASVDGLITNVLNAMALVNGSNYLRETGN